MKKHKNIFFVFSLKSVKTIFVVVLALLFVVLFFSSSPAISTFLNKRSLPVYSVDNKTNEICLTFDAAWGSDKTKKIIDKLNEYDVTATFFLVGMWVDKNEDLVKIIDENNFEIGTHSNTHKDFTKLTKNQIESELLSSKNKIKNIINKEVKVFRAPYGAYNNMVIDTSREINLQVIQWDVDSLDWKGISKEKIAKNILTKTKSGSIILCHNNADNIVEALDLFIPILKKRGFKFKKISELVYFDNYTIDNTGKQFLKL